MDTRKDETLTEAPYVAPPPYLPPKGYGEIRVIISEAILSNPTGDLSEAILQALRINGVIA